MSFLIGFLWKWGKTSIMTAISDFYAGRTIFVTGVTGFMGKVLLEKLLRSCPAIHQIYVLIRPKRGLTVPARLAQLLETKLFEKLKEMNPDFQKKILPVVGDILEPGLGLSVADVQRLSAEVSIVFHSAATVKFDEPLKLSVQMNIVGVSRLLDLCHKMVRIEALVHVSTAYANCNRSVVMETVYDPPILPKKIMNAVEWMDDDVLSCVTRKLIHPRPNTYTFTKAIAEYLVFEECQSLPCAIVRPSIVGASWLEPIQGWVDNFNGPSGLLAAIGKGMLRVMAGDCKGCADIIPVDLAVNMIIAAAWSTAIERPTSPQVFNCTTGQLNRVTWGQVERSSEECLLKFPLDAPVRLPVPRFTMNRFYHEMNRIFDHLLPAWIMDLGLRLVGKKPVLLRLQMKLWRSVACLEYFTSNQWTFMNDNVTQLFSRMCADDQKEFNFDVRRIHWPTYLENYCLGVKRFALKEDLSKLPEARLAIHRLVLRKRLKQLLFVIIFLWMVRWRQLMQLFGQTTLIVVFQMYTAFRRRFLLTKASK